MTAPSPFAAALTGPPEAVVCFDRHGAERSLRELVSAAASVEARLGNLDGERWALNLADVFEFAAALLGCWAAGRTAVLAPAPLLAALGPGSFDGVIEAPGDATPAAQRVELEGLEPARRPLAAIGGSAAFTLYTSGSTGQPKRVNRRLANAEHELAAFESLWGGGLGACRVFATVSHRHVYGLLFRVLWPLCAHRPFATFDFEYPEQLQGVEAEGAVLVSSPALLKRVGHLPAAPHAWRAVFSSGGVLPADAAAGAARVLGAPVTEVLGSTETSGVAWRTAPAQRFTPLPSVQVRLSADELLEVRSPFSGADDWQRMGDRALLGADGRIELLGRADRVAKIEDKRVSLTDIEALLAAHAFVKDAAAVALERDGRQYVGAVVELTAEGRAALAQRGRAALGAALRVALRGKLDAVAVPRVFRYRDTIPVDAQGKRQAAALAALFARR